MPIQNYRELKPTPEAEATFKRWVLHLNEEFNRHPSCDRRSEIVRDELYQLYLGRPHGGRPSGTLVSEMVLNVVGESFDPRNVTLEPEYYGDIDPRQYAPRKPLIYLWQMFDRSPLGANQWLGFKLRCMLARHIFRHVGKNVRIFQNVEFTFGYNLSLGDNVTIHRNVLLDDRGEIVIHDNTTLSDYVNVYSHLHDIHNPLDVTTKKTEIGPGARVTYHSTVLPGANLGENAMLGAMGLATRPVPASAISVGIPAKQIRSKDDQPKKEDEAAPPNNSQSDSQPRSRPDS